MSRVLTSFLVGFGLDLSQFDTGQRDLNRRLGGIKSTILQTGAALTGVFGAKALTLDFSKQTDQLAQFSNMIGVTANDMRALGNTFKVAGGDEERAYSILETLTRARDVLAVKGEAGFLTDVAFAGIDPKLISQSTDAYDALLKVIGQFDQLSPERQRVLADTLGLGPAEVALFKTGRDSVEASIETMKRLRPVLNESQEASRQLRGEMALLGVQSQGIADQISVPIVKGLADMTAAVNDWMDASRPMIDSGIGRFVKFTSDNFTELAGAAALIGAGATLSTMGKLATFIPAIGAGIGTLAAGAARLSFVGAGVTAGAMLWDWKPEDVENVTGWKPPEWLFKPIGELWDGIDWGGNVGDKDNIYMRASREASKQRSEWNTDTPLQVSDPMGYSKAVKPDDTSANVNWLLGNTQKPDDTSANVNWLLGNTQKPDDTSANVNWSLGNTQKPDDTSANVNWSLGNTQKPDDTSANVNWSLGNTQKPDDLQLSDPLGYRRSYDPITVNQTVTSNTPPQKVQLEAKHLPPIQVNSTLTLNGQVLEQTITEVNARHAQSAMEDLTSTTDR